MPSHTHNDELDVWYVPISQRTKSYCRANSMFPPSQWETVLPCNDVCHWLGASLELALNYIMKSRHVYFISLQFELPVHLFISFWNYIVMNIQWKCCCRCVWYCEQLWIISQHWLWQCLCDEFMTGYYKKHDDRVGRCIKARTDKEKLTPDCSLFCTTQ